MGRAGAVVKSVDAWIELEHRVDRPGGSTGWSTCANFDPNTSVEQARKSLDYYVENPAHERSKYRLVYVRVETTREVIEP